VSYLIFLAVLLFAAIVTAVLRLFGFGLTFEVVFKALATAVVFLPMVLMSALVVFIVEFGICMVALLMLHLTGLVHPADIPKQYQVFGLWGLAVLAIGIVVFAALLNFSHYGKVIKKKAGERT
jgi:hypothetical protein